MTIQFGLLQYFERQSKSKGEFEERMTNVRELQKAARKYSNDGPCLVKPPVQQKKIMDNDNDDIDLGKLFNGHCRASKSPWSETAGARILAQKRIRQHNLTTGSDQKCRVPKPGDRRFTRLLLGFPHFQRG